MKTRVRAVILDDGNVLLIKRIRPGVTYWVFPGGAVGEGETDEEALVRECNEELGVVIKVKYLLREMISEKPEVKGQREFFYLCEIISGLIGTGGGPEFKKDSAYIGGYDIEWRRIRDLKKIDVRPVKISSLIYNKYFNNESD